jgi:hypothetical protein
LGGIFELYFTLIGVRRTIRIGLEGVLASTKGKGKQFLAIRLDRQTIQKAKILAARRSTSISGLVARQMEILVGEQEAYERAERQTLTLLDPGFALGDAMRVAREEFHER